MTARVVEWTFPRFGDLFTEAKHAERLRRAQREARCELAVAPDCSVTVEVDGARRLFRGGDELPPGLLLGGAVARLVDVGVLIAGATPPEAA